MPVKQINEFPAVVAPAGADLLVTQQDADNVTRKMTVTQTVQAVDPKAHKALHENGGADEISVAGLSGLLADAQTVLAHNFGGVGHNADTLANISTRISDGTIILASQAEAEAGAENTKRTTSLRVAQAIAALQRAIATQAEAEAGTNNTKDMTPLRTKQAIDALGGLFSKSFVSAEQTITSAGALTIAHSLAEMPKLVQVRIKNTTAELNYSVDDEVIINPAGNDPVAAANRGLSLVVDSTNLVIRYGSAAATFSIINKTTGAVGSITNSSWKMIVRAYA